MTEDDDPKGPAAGTPSEPAEKDKSSGTDTEDKTEESAETETEETAEKADGEDEADDDSDDEPKKKRPSRSERYQRQIERLKAQNEELRSRPSAGSQSDEQIASAVERIIGKPPNQDEFKGDYLAFDRAQTAYELDKRQTTREVQKDAQRHELKAQERLREVEEAHQERADEFREKAPDYDDVIKAAAARNQNVSPAMRELIYESDISAHLLYFLAKNPKELDKLNVMSPLAAAKAVGGIEKTLSLPSPKTQTQARKPVLPLKGGAAPSSQERDLENWLNRKYGKKA